MNRSLCLTALSLLTLGLSTPAVPCQGGVEDVLPASSYAVVRFGGLDQATAVGERLGLMRLGQILMERGGDEAFQQLVGPAIEEAATEVRRELGHFGISPGDLRSLLQRPMALGIGRPTMFGEEMIPSVALVIHAGNRPDPIGRILQLLETHLVQMGPDIAVEERTLGGHRVRILSAAEQLGNVVIGRVGDFFLVSNSRGYFRDCVRVIDGDAPSLSAMAAVRQNLPERARISGYLTPRPLFSVLDPFLPYEATEIGEGLGIQGMNGLYFGISGAGAGTAEVMHFGLTGSEAGILRAPFAGPVSLEAARYCSADTVLFGAASLNGAAFLDAGQRMLELLPRDMREEVWSELSRELGRELENAGMSLEHVEGLLRSIGPSLSVAINVPHQLVPIPEILAFLDIPNPQAIEPLIHGIMDETELEWRTTTARGHEIYYANVRVEQVMLSPCFTFADGMLVMSSHVRNLKAALSQRENPEESLAAQPSFRRLQQDVGDATALVHVRGSKIIELTWPLAESQLRMVLDGPGREMGLDSDLIPEVQDVSQALGSSTLSLHVDEDGVFVKQVSNTGPGTLLAAAAMFLDAVLQQAQGRIF